ncbi:alanine racemase [Crossiella cryophila]|uniref:Diaminopimelate decarboxylase n=1 Tax=Crossiella cryophila TaxID=43355 RepID=A0A7W7CHP2_9PSEU|nr:alanine racemase [Crossiella cryophila]MBB4681330.1 diaminopimelate decarboxylase [Crossiella cryophila]
MDLPISAEGRPALAATDLPPHIRAELLARAGDPLAPVSGYVYDPAVAAERVRGLRAALPGWAKVCYAVKANTYRPLLAAMAPHLDGFEVSSAAEADLARAVSPTALLVSSGPGKTLPTLNRLLHNNIGVVNVESRLELARLNQAAGLAGRRVAVTIRVNPKWVEVAGSLTMGGAATVFGLPEDEVPAALGAAAALPNLDVVGFHVHAVCQNMDAVAHAAYVRWCLEWSAATAAEHGVQLRAVGVGGGIGVPFEGGPEFDTMEFCELLGQIEPPSGVDVVFEPGRWCVTDAGWYAAEVVDVKHAYGTWFAVLRGGINHFQLPTSWDIRHPFAVLPVDTWPVDWPRPEAVDVPVTVVGELCTPEDTLARDFHVSRVRAGDLVVFPMAGSYGYEFAMPNFLGHPPADRRTVSADGTGQTS